MARLTIDEIEVGVRGQRITIAGSLLPKDDSRYRTEETLDMSLQQARELYRMLAAMIPIAEASASSAPVLVMCDEEKETV